MHSDVLVTRDQPSVEFLSYTQATAAEATLDVSMNVAVSEGTCFQCTVDIIGGRVSSEKGCVTSVGEPYEVLDYVTLSVLVYLCFDQGKLVLFTCSKSKLGFAMHSYYFYTFIHNFLVEID